MPKFTRRHYEDLAKGMAQMAHGLERVEAQCMMSLPSKDRDILKSQVYAATMDAMMAVFAADNPQFSSRIFVATFKGHLADVLRKINLDKCATLRYTIAGGSDK